MGHAVKAPGLVRLVIPVLQLPLHNPIAIARRIVELGDQSGLLKNASRYRDAGASCPQHLPQKFLGERKAIRENPILAHQNPSRQSFLHLAPSVARRNLRGLHGQPMGEAMQPLCQLRILMHKLPEILGAAPVSFGVTTRVGLLW